MPRVVAGKWKGFPLEVQKGSKTRPTADRVKEAIFSIILERVPGSRFLDCFAGCGQMGLEALSRGASYALMIEKNRGAFTALCKNVEKTHCKDSVDLHLKDSSRVLKQLAEEIEESEEKEAELARRGFDLVYFDPPWREEGDFLSKMAPSIAGLLRKDGLLIVEADRESFETPELERFELLRTCHYGRVVVLFYSLEDGKDDPDASLDLPG